SFFSYNVATPTGFYSLSLHDALPISAALRWPRGEEGRAAAVSSEDREPERVQGLLGERHRVARRERRTTAVLGADAGLAVAVLAQGRQRAALVDAERVGRRQIRDRDCLDGLRRAGQTFAHAHDEARAVRVRRRLAAVSARRAVADREVGLQRSIEAQQMTADLARLPG